MMSAQLPSVLQANKGNSLSMERALKQAKMLLEQYTEVPAQMDDTLTTSIDDLETMLTALNRD